MVSVTDHDFSGGARPSPHRRPGEDAARGGLPEEADGFAVARGRLWLPQVVATCGPWFGRGVRDRGLRYDVDQVKLPHHRLSTKPTQFIVFPSCCRAPTDKEAFWCP